MDTKKISAILPGATITGKLRKPLSLLTDDSRKVEPGCCYIAIRGTQFDGHSVIDSAIADRPRTWLSPDGRDHRRGRSARDSFARRIDSHSRA